MADYKGIKGFTIPNVSSDPDNPIAGQIWYNSTSATLKGEVEAGVGEGTWAAGGSLSTARNPSGAMSGIQTAALNISGPYAGSVDNVEQYNGTSWTEIADVNAPRENAMSSSSGPATATLFVAGNGPGAVTYCEQFNGTSWTEVNDVNTAKGQGAGVGTETAALVFGGVDSWYTAKTEDYNGTSWTEVADLNLARANLSSFGIQALAFGVGGRAPGTPAIKPNVESWNGTSWTETTEANTAKSEASGSGVTTAGLFYGGAAPPGNTATTEYWNGSSWTELADLATAGSRISCNMGASSTATIVPLQASPSLTTEEWNVPDTTTVTITTS